MSQRKPAAHRKPRIHWTKRREIFRRFMAGETVPHLALELWRSCGCVTGFESHWTREVEESIRRYARK